MSRRRVTLDMAQLVPGGILETDSWWSDPDPGMCSRCRRYPPEDEAPLLLWSPDGHQLLRYCANCTECAA